MARSKFSEDGTIQIFRTILVVRVEAFEWVAHIMHDRTTATENIVGPKRFEFIYPKQQVPNFSSGLCSSLLFLRCPSDRIRALGRGSVLFFEWSALALMKAARVNKSCNFGDPDC